MVITKFLFPLIVFGLAFLAPLIAQSITAMGFSGLSIDNIYNRLSVSGAFGMLEQL